MKHKYKKGDVVVLTINPHLSGENSVSRRFTGREISILEADNYNEYNKPCYTTMIENKSWVILERQIIGLKKIDNWKKRLEE